MPYRSFNPARFVVMSTLLILSAGAASAQTVANGPYYATPSWDQTLPCTSQASCPRFVVLLNMNSEGVLDRETGLVWERNVAEAPVAFGQADSACNNRVLGNRQGWRLPTHPELRTLIDPATVPLLPPGHPFVNVHAEFTPPFFPIYWTTTPSKQLPDFLMGVTFSILASNFINPAGGATARFWCVRSPGPGIP